MKKDNVLADVFGDEDQDLQDSFANKKKATHKHESDKLNQVEEEFNTKVTGKDGMPKNRDGYYDFNKDWDIPNMTSRQQAILDVAHYQFENATSKILNAYSSDDPDERKGAIKDLEKLPVSHEDLAKIMSKDYKFATYPQQSSYAPQLMYYCDEKSDKVHYGTYISNYSSGLLLEAKKVYPPFKKRDLEDLVPDILAIGDVKKANPNDSKAKAYIPVCNGLFNKKTKKLEPFTSKLVYTMKVLTDYNDKAKAVPNVKGGKILDAVKLTVGADQYKTALQVLYDAFDSTTNHDKLPFMIGKPHTGKSTFEAVATSVINGGGIGSHVAGQPLTNFGEDFGLSPLTHAMLDVGDNVNTDAYINAKASDNIHSLSTGDPVDVNVKNKTPYSFYYHGLILSNSNGYPKFADNVGIMSRLLIVKFTHNFGDDAKHSRGDNRFKDRYIKTRKVREHVLYVVLHQPDFQDYTISDRGQDELNTWKVNSSPIEDFANDIFIGGNIERLPVRFAYTVSKYWYKANGYKRLSFRMFTEKLEHALDGKYTKKIARVRVKDADKAKSAVDKCHLDYTDEIDFPTKGDTAKCFVASSEFRAKLDEKKVVSKATEKQLDDDDDKVAEDSDLHQAHMKELMDKGKKLEKLESYCDVDALIKKYESHTKVKTDDGVKDIDNDDLPF